MNMPSAEVASTGKVGVRGCLTVGMREGETWSSGPPPYRCAIHTLGEEVFSDRMKELDRLLTRMLHAKTPFQSRAGTVEKLQ